MSKTTTPHEEKVRIRSAVDGYRRGGIAHTVEAKEHPVSDFSATQLEQIKNDSRLSVEFVTADNSTGTDTDAAGAVDVDSVELDLTSLTVSRLKEIAAMGEVAGFASMKKDQLIAAIESARDAEHAAKAE